MSQSVQMPALGESVTEGTVTRWLKNVGDRIEVDEPLLEVSTDKVDTEIPSPAAGVLEEILVQVDETAPVGADLARIGDGSGGGAAAPSVPDTSSAETSAPADTPEVPSTEAPAPGEAPVAHAPEPAAPPPSAPSAPSAPAGGGGGGSGTSVTLPEMGESVTEGTVTRWLKQVGDQVEVDEALVEVSTDKVDTEVPSPVAGTLLSITVAEDSTVEVGGELGVIGDASAAPAAAPAPEPEPAPAARAGGPAGTCCCRRTHACRGTAGSPGGARSGPGRRRRQTRRTGREAAVAAAGRARGRTVRHPGDPEAGFRQRHRPGVGAGHRSGRPDPP